MNACPVKSSQSVGESVFIVMVDRQSLPIFVVDRHRQIPSQLLPILNPLTPVAFSKLLEM